MNSIPVVLSSDNSIFFALGTTIVSILENAGDETFYDIHVLYTSDVSQENLDKLLSLKQKYANFSLNIYNMSDKFNSITMAKGYHVNYVSAYKMLLPQMLSQYNKIIYLDTDTLVRGDLSELYNFDLGDNYLAGVPVVDNYVNATLKKLPQMLGIPNLDFYINAGVMLMNLEKIRNDKIDEKWISLLGTFKDSVDQHILNKVCYGKTIIMPLKYNVCYSSLKEYEDGMCIFYSIKDIKDAKENPVIFHWTGKYKPWKYADIFLSHEWFRYFAKSPFYFELNRDNIYYAYIVLSIKAFGRSLYRVKSRLRSKIGRFAKKLYAFKQKYRIR